jgi:hypothetical protein
MEVQCVRLNHSPTSVLTQSTLAAKKAVQEQLRAQGVQLVKPADIAAQARAYLDANPHLYEEAIQRAFQMGLIKQHPLAMER